LGVEEDLEEEVAEFIGEFGVVGGFEGFEDFVGFFEEVGAEGHVGLFAVPGAAVGCAEAGHGRDEFFEGGAGRLHAQTRPVGHPGGTFGSFSFAFWGGHGFKARKRLAQRARRRRAEVTDKREENAFSNRLGNDRLRGLEEVVERNSLGERKRLT
jgi:hypothetical protein